MTTAEPVGPDEFEVLPATEAAADLIAFARRYWSLLGVNEYHEAVWEEPLSAFSHDSGISHRRAYLLAAAGARAVLPQHTCGQCDGPLSVQTREAFEQHLAGQTPENCIDCDPLFMTAVSREATPAAAQRRAVDRDRAQLRINIEAARERWADEQAAHVAVHHDGSGSSGRLTGPAPLAVQLTAITLLFPNPDAATIEPVMASTVPLTPNPPMTETLLAACQDHDLLRTHPQSPVEACRWEQTFDEALIAAGHQPAAVGSPRCAGIVYAGAQWCRPELEAGAEPEHPTVRAWMESLTPDQLSLGQVAELSDLGGALIVAETLRQFEAGLYQLRLAPVPEQHRLRLQQTVTDMAAWLTIAQCATLVVKAVKGAAKVKESNPKIRASAVTTHAVNRLVGDWERIWQKGEPGDSVSPTVPSGAFCSELSRLTRLVFALYGMNPWDADLATVWSTQGMQVWPQTPTAPAAMIVDPASGIDLQAVLQALRDLDDTELVEDWALLEAVSQINDVVKRMLDLTGDLRTALAAGFVVAEKLTTPVAVPGSPGTFRFAGWHIIEVMMRAGRQ